MIHKVNPPYQARVRHALPVPHTPPFHNFTPGHITGSPPPRRGPPHGFQGAGLRVVAFVDPFTFQATREVEDLRAQWLYEYASRIAKGALRYVKTAGAYLYIYMCVWIHIV